MVFATPARQLPLHIFKELKAALNAVNDDNEAPRVDMEVVNSEKGAAALCAASARPCTSRS